MADLLINCMDTRPKGQRLMGLDVGKKTIGLALSDPGHSIATPLQTIQRTKFTKDMEALAALAADYEVKGFIIGLPVNMDGSEGPRAQSVRDFALELERFMSDVLLSPQQRGSDERCATNPRLHGGSGKCWTALWDERLSTVSVESFVDDFVEKRKTKAQSKSSGLIDKLAAQHILQGALDFLGQQP